MRVGFLIAGVQKAGTTALDAFLRTHPGIAMPSRKEVHFFDDEHIDWATSDYVDYHACFEPEAGQIAGECTPIYSYWAPCMERIRTYNPDMRLILCLRDQVKRAFSQWEMEVSRNHERYTFDVAIREGRARVATDENSKYGCHRVFSYVERGFYARQIKHMLSLFPRDQILFLENDRMRNDQSGVLDDICDFIDAERFVEYPANKNIVPTAKRDDLGRISDEDAAYLADLYAIDARETAKLTGLNLSHWSGWR